MPDQRVTYRRRHSYRTKSNKILLKKTPGGKNAVHYQKKIGSTVKCGDTGASLIGLPRLRPMKFMSISKRQKTVSRAYGGTLCGKAVRERIVRAFLVEEKKYALKLQKKAA